MADLNIDNKLYGLIKRSHQPIDPEEKAKRELKRQKIDKYAAITLASAAAVTLLFMAGRYACVNDRSDREQIQSKKPAATAPSRLEDVTNQTFNLSVSNNTSDVIQTLKNDYKIADDSYYQGSKDRKKYQASIDSCTEALTLIDQNNVWKHYKDDFLYMRGRAKTNTGDLDGAVKDFLDSLASASLEKDPNHDQGTENQSNLALYQLLSGKYKATAKTALKKYFGQYDLSEQQKILGNLWKEQKNTAYTLLSK